VAVLLLLWANWCYVGDVLLVLMTVMIVDVDIGDEIDCGRYSDIDIVGVVVGIVVGYSPLFIDVVDVIVGIWWGDCCCCIPHGDSIVVVDCCCWYVIGIVLI